MKRLLLALSVLVLLTTAVPQSYALSPFLSWWDAEDADNGFGIGLKKSVFDAPFISLEPRISWLHFSDHDINMFPLELAALARISIVYGGVGGGFYMINQEIKDRLGWFVLAGVELELSGFGIFGELKYSGVETEFVEFPEVKIDMSGPSVNVGVKLNVL